MEIKYEPLFGPQELFDNAPDDTVAVRVNDYKSITYYFLTEGHLTLTNSHELKAIPIVAMRRIIRAPTWMVADQKAGRLPEVGAELLHESEGYVNFVGEFDFRWMLRTKEGGLYLAEKFYCSPIESPEEKAARLREEWKNNVIEIHHGKRRKMSTSTFILDDIYDALLSGDLPVPVKDGE